MKLYTMQLFSSETKNNIIFHKKKKKKEKMVTEYYPHQNDEITMLTTKL